MTKSLKRGGGDQRSGGPIHVLSSTADGPGDWQCDGLDDEQEIQAALNELPAVGGKITLSEGTFNLSAQVSRAIDNVTIEGHGGATILAYNGVDPAITAGTQSGWSIRDLHADAGSTSPVPVSISDTAAQPATMMLPTVAGATITGGIAPIFQSYHALFPASTLESTVTSSTQTGPATLTDSGKTWVLNTYANKYVASVNATGPVYATILSNTTNGVLTVDAWTDETGAGTNKPSDSATYVIVANAVDLNTLNAGSGNQFLVLSVQPVLPAALVITVTLKNGVDNIICSTGADVTVTPSKRVLLVRDSDNAPVKWYTL